MCVMCVCVCAVVCVPRDHMMMEGWFLSRSTIDASRSTYIASYLSTTMTSALATHTHTTETYVGSSEKWSQRPWVSMLASSTT